MNETLAKVVLVSLVAATVPLDATEPSIWMQWGLAGLVVAYVLWRDWQRERRLSAAIEAQQRWIRETLVGTLERNAAAMERMAMWLETSSEPPQWYTRPARTGAVGGNRS
jgi:hypothetical protein